MAFGFRRLEIGFALPDLKGLLNPAELVKAALAGLGASTLAGLAVAVLSAISADLAAIVPNPAVAALVAFILGQAIDQFRRLGHGAVPAPVAPAVPSAIDLHEEAEVAKILPFPGVPAQPPA